MPVSPTLASWVDERIALGRRFSTYRPWPSSGPWRCFQWATELFYHKLNFYHKLKIACWQLFFLYLGETYNRTLNTIVVKCFKSEPFLLNSFKLTFQSNDNARNLLILYSKCMNKWIPWMHEIDYHNHMLKTTMSTNVYERVETLESKHWSHEFMTDPTETIYWLHGINNYYIL